MIKTIRDAWKIPELKKKIIAKARQVVLVVTKSKCDKMLPYTVCGFDEIDCVVTDAQLPDDIEELCRENGVKVVQA